MRDDVKHKRARAVRTAIILAVVALAFYFGSFYFLTN